MNWYMFSATTDSAGQVMPLVPNGIAWVGLWDSVSNAYLLCTDSTLGGLTPLTPDQMQNEIDSLGLSLTDINQWFAR